ncbi:hypothetical protein CBS101457_004117 [Exobasidium rhododendri]|nr:hypothetical protein CBS101457_004117 [Exobasidium rhododendri]
MSIARSTLRSPLLRCAVPGSARKSVSSIRPFSTTKADTIPIAASSDSGANTASVTVAIKAGPRFETQPGLAHVLKNYTFKSNGRRSALALVREAELYGGVLSTSLTKEHLLLTAEFLRGDEEFFVEVLGDVLSSSKFLSHEFHEEVLPQVQTEFEQSLNSPSILGFDQLTQTAYRQRGLGASLFSSPASPISHSQVVDYAHSVFAKDNIAVVGSGIDSGYLSKLVSTYFKDVRPTKGSIQAGSKQYFGGDARVSYTPNHAVDGIKAHYGHYFIAFEGAGVDASPELAVLRSYLGGESSVKWSTGLSPLAQISEKVPGANANAFNLNFTDSGLFGAYITAPTSKVILAAQETTKALKEATKSISKEDLEKAKAKARFEVAAAIESRAGIHSAVGGQLLEAKNVQLLEESFSQLESVSSSALASAVSKLLEKKATTVAVGDVHKLPYADECF